MHNTFGHLTECKDKLIDFLIQHSVLANTIRCSKCGNDVNINKETIMYRCRKRYTVKNEHKKRISKQCTYEKNAKAGTWFGGTHRHRIYRPSIRGVGVEITREKLERNRMLWTTTLSFSLLSFFCFLFVSPKYTISF